MRGVCPLGYGVQFHDLLSGSMLGSYKSWEEDPKQEHLFVFQFFFSCFQMCQTTVIISEMVFSEVSKFNLSYLFAGKHR